MTQFSKKKKEIIQWIASITLIIILFTTGLHTEVLGGIQRFILATGINKPEIPGPTTGFDSVAKADIRNYKYNFPMKTLKGEDVNLKSLKGKVVFLNLWASWCPPCITEMPGIQKLYDKIDKSKVAFVMLSLDEDQQKGKKLIERKKYTFPVYFPSEGIHPGFYSSAIPTTFILDTEGNILTRHEGMADYNTEEFKNYLMSLSN